MPPEVRVCSSPPVNRNKSYYAVVKCREALREYANDISAQSIYGEKYKVVVLGDSGVGKTSLIYSYKYGDINVPFNSTIGASFVTCTMCVKGDPTQLQVWDTAGQERFRSMVPMYMRNANAAIFVYDVTNRQSFEDIEKWFVDLTKMNSGVEPVVVLIGNKADLESKRQVMTGEGVTKALKMNARFYEVSMFQHDVIDNILRSLVLDVRNAIDNHVGPESKFEFPPHSAKISLSSSEESLPLILKKKLFGCCSL